MSSRAARSRSKTKQSSEGTRSSPGRRKQRLVIGLGVFLLLAIVLVPVWGYMHIYLGPSHEWAAQVDGKTVVTLGDLVNRMETDQLVNQASGNSAAPDNPYDLLQRMVQDNLIVAEAPQFGVQVTDSDVDQAIKDTFYPAGGSNSGTSSDQLDREFHAVYDQFLTRARLSDAQYRKIVRLGLYHSRMRDELGKRVAAVQNEVEISWIRVAQGSDPSTVTTALQQGQAFEDVARQSNTETYFADHADRPGYVGWVPQGAFPQLDKLLFGGSASPNAFTGPIIMPDGTYFVKILAGPEVREVDNPKMMTQLKEQALLTWVQGVWDQRDVKIKFSSTQYRWVVDEVRKDMVASR